MRDFSKFPAPEYKDTVLAPLFEGATPAIENADEHLLLWGLHLIAQRNAKK